MEVSEQQKEDIDAVLQEANLLGIEIVEKEQLVAATFHVLALDDQGNPPDDPRIGFRFQPVGRVAASLTRGTWTDPAPDVIPMAAAELLSVTQDLQAAVYGGDFVDSALEREDYHWLHRLSLDWRSEDAGMNHHIHFFQEGPDRHLEVAIWFDAFTICDVAYRQLDLEVLGANARRFWEAFFAGDPAAKNEGAKRGLYKAAP